MVMPTFSVSSVTLIFRLANITSMFITIGILLDGQIVFRLHLDRSF